MNVSLRRQGSKLLIAGLGIALIALGTVATPGAQAVPAVQDPAQIDRIAGSDRYATSVEISKATWNAGAAGAVVLARGDTFPDALAAGPLAAVKNGPLLITPPSRLRSDTRAEIQRALPVGRKVYLLGDTSSISAGIEAELGALGYVTKRLSGANRYETATLIANEIRPLTPNVWLATGRNFPDALAAAAMAAHLNGSGAFPPHIVLLTDGPQVPAATADYIDGMRQSLTFMRLNTVGADADAAAHSAFGQDDFFQIRSNVGANRYDTATKLVKDYVGTVNQVGLASGETFPDALSAAGMVAEKRIPLLLTKPSQLPAEVADYLQQVDPSGAPGTLTVFGSIADPVATTAANLMGDVADRPDRVILPDGPSVSVKFAADQEGALTFVAPAVGHPRLTITSGLIGSCRLAVTVFQPTGDVLTGADCVDSSATFILDGLTSDGTSRIFLDPYGSAAGSVSVRLEIVEDLPDQPIVPDGPPVTVAFEPGQNGGLTFDATAGTKLRLVLVDRTFDDPCDVAVQVPGNSVSCFELPLVIELVEDGGHRIFFDPVDVESGSLTVRLETVQDLPDATIVPDGPPLDLTFEPGQNVQLHFDSAADQKMLFTATCDQPDGCGYALVLLAPDGESIRNTIPVTGVPIVFEPLAQAGTYDLFIDPFVGTVTTFTFELDTIHDPADQPIVVDGPPVTLTLGPGQNGAMSFTGSAGDRLRLTAGFPSPLCQSSLRLVQPDGGQQFDDTPCVQGGQYFELVQSGVHRLVLDPVGADAGSLTFELESVQDLPDQEIIIDGPAVTLDFQSGQNATLTFDAAVTDDLKLVVTQSTFFGCGPSMVVTAPGAAEPFQLFTCPGEGSEFPLGALPATGTYTILLDPGGSTSGTFGIRLQSV